jgi:site-specific DNA-adenine methylase
MTSLLTPKAYKPPFPYFGGKSKVATEVWRRFGAARNFVEPFCGSAAMLMLRPGPWEGTETVNDADGMICNFWRAVQWAPEEMSKWADWPVIENDLHARHIWLRERREILTGRLEGDPEYFDAKIAGWWCWGQCCWIGGGWCDPNTTGPWGWVIGEDGFRQLAHLGNGGHGVSRKRVHVGNAGRGVNRRRVNLHWARGVARTSNGDLADYFRSFTDRLKHVRVCCGDWRRVCGLTPTVKQGLTAVFLDPPYGDAAKRDMQLYTKDSGTVAGEVRQWAIEHGDDPRMRIALCGYAGEHAMPTDWFEWAWKANGGYSKRGTTAYGNARRERIWFSPHCLP